MAKWVGSVSTGIVAGVVASWIITATTPTQGNTALIDWVVKALPVVAGAASAGAEAVGLLHLATWAQARSENAI